MGKRSATHQPNPATTTAPNLQPRELVIVDTATPDYQQLIDDILEQNTDANLTEVILLDSSRDGFEQLNQILSGYTGLDAVHLISHGSDGAVSIGNSTLNNSSLTPINAINST